MWVTQISDYNFGLINALWGSGVGNNKESKRNRQTKITELGRL